MRRDDGHGPIVPGGDSSEDGGQRPFDKDGAAHATTPGLGRSKGARRACGRASPADLAGPSSARPLLEPDTRRRLRAALEGLPARARNALILHKFQGLPYREIARRLHVSPLAVERDVARGLDACRRALADQPPAHRRRRVQPVGR